jgi:hypothetical protein
VAVQRGPLVYCLELPGDPGADLDALAIDQAAGLRDEPADGPGDVAVQVRATGHRLPVPELAPWPYHRAGPATGAGEPTELHLIPYYAWANRGPSTMRVWIPYH